MIEMAQVNEVIAPGLGIYQQSEYSSQDDNENLDEPAINQWEVDLHRFVLPSKNLEIPKLESLSFIDVINYVIKILYLFSLRMLQNIRIMLCHTLCNLRSFIFPPSLAQTQQQYIEQICLGRLEQKWRQVQELPTYISQADSVDVLEKIHHSSDHENESFIKPEECSNKVQIKLELDAHNRPFVTCLLAGTIVTKLLVDSGAAICCLRADDFEKIPDYKVLPRIKHVPKVYDHQGNVIPSNTAALIEVSFSGKTLILPFIISKFSSTNILGMSSTVGRSLSFTISGSEAVLIIGEAKLEHRPKMVLGDKMTLFVQHDVMIAAEQSRRIAVTPIVFPMTIEIPDKYVKITYLEDLEGFEGITHFAKFDKQGRIHVYVRNVSIIDLQLYCCQIIATAEFVSAKPPKSTKSKIKNNMLSSFSTNPEVDDEEFDKTIINEILKEMDDNLGQAKSSETAAPIEQLQEKQNKSNKSIDCFCNSDYKTFIIRGNSHGDCVVPFANYCGYTRTTLSETSPFKYSRKGLNFIIIYGKNPSKITDQIKNYVNEPGIAYIGNKDKTETDVIPIVNILGNCTHHPFPFSINPHYVSFVLTNPKDKQHLLLIHNLKQRCQFQLSDTFIELYYDHSQSQAHYVLHLCDIIQMQRGLLQNILAALVMPFIGSVRILEPWLSKTKTFKHQVFASMLHQVTKLHNLTMQGRIPEIEPITYPSQGIVIPKCPCEFCLSERDKALYETNPS
jgi:hypothetical protein